MTHRVALGAVLASIALGVAREARADPFARAEVRRQEWSASGSDVDVEVVDGSLAVPGTSAAVTYADDSGSWTGLGSASASAGMLRAFASAAGTTTSGRLGTETFARAQWSDTLVLDVGGVSKDDLSYLGGDLVFEWTVDGMISATVHPGSSVAGSNAEVEFGADGSARSANLRFPSSGTASRELDWVLEGVDSPSGLGVYKLDATLKVRAQALHGSAFADFSATARLTGITFASDGTRPEDHGFVLVFGSGLASPNLPAVPEPATVLLFGLGAAGLLARRRRRQRA